MNAARQPFLRRTNFAEDRFGDEDQQKMVTKAQGMCSPSPGNSVAMDEVIL